MLAPVSYSRFIPIAEQVRCGLRRKTARRHIGACGNENTRKTGRTMKTRIPKKSQNKAGARTLAIHAGEPRRHGVAAAVVTEVCPSSTFTFASSGEMKRWAEGKGNSYIYTRYGNPTL